jgi:hypothetical protein
MGVLSVFKPERMAEIGVSAGTLSAALLTKSAQYSDASILYGIDYSTHAYYEEDINTAKTVYEVCPELSGRLLLHTEKTTLDSDSIFTHELDFVYIDANHCHPWAAFDCINLLPHLSANALVGFHDTVVSSSRLNAGVFAFHSIDLEKFEDAKLDVFGSGFCVYTGDSDKVLSSLLRSFSLPWEIAIDQSTLDLFVTKIGNNFGSGWKRKFADQIEYAAPFYRTYYESQLAARKAFEDRIYNSTSWKMSAPLRWIKNLVGR